ncbi:fimbria/pilus outer membrane usher protein [Janthinobacterium fluminis]|uniref:Fimbria/pilus outer membrane usher protein n=1 Tax=Janthinobacterium fluminis TaxID=2987524 RepID=A0ABT5K5C9_9BURK|nr:fimbria/pilus outer membrane usher protein [Janthinobacterium fluminis]MDC8760188.1 fimbria/pilus outer membrane usher protein [Janthinobacterium fluminis]
MRRPGPWLLFWLGLAGAGPAPARAQTAPPAQAAAADNELYLEVSLNAQASGLILRFTQSGKGLRSSVENFRRLGLDPARFGLAGQAEVELDAVPGLSYVYDAGRQSVALRLADALRTPLALSARTLRPAPPATATPGAVLNYDAYAQFGGQTRLALFHELRYFDARGVFSSSASAREGGYLRYDTFWRHADVGTLRTFQVGDLIASSLSWSRAVRLGGLQWRKNFELRPDLLTFPQASLGGSALVPSALSLYINGVQHYTASVPDGPFVLNQVAGVNGAGQATLVTRDALGRAVSSTVPLYVDTRMLAQGLSDYSFELGALRRDYGTRSFGYAAAAAGASVRHGLSDALTVEGHVELARGLYNGGAGALLRLGQGGVLNASLAASGGRGGGAQAGVGYQYIGPRFSVDAQTLRASRGYADLAAHDGSPVASASDRLSLNAVLADGHSVGLSYIGYRAAAATARIAALYYSASVGGGAFFSVSAFQDAGNRRNRGVAAALSFAFGERLVGGAGAGQQNGQRNSSVYVQRAPDFGGGVGWGLQAGALGGVAYRQAQLQYLGANGQLGATTHSGGGRRISSANAAGALVLMDGTLSAARQVGSGFALVSTAGVADVPVIHENRRIGVTGRSGHLLVPNLNAHNNNLIAIDTEQLAVDARVPTTRLNIVPQALSGVLARFPVERYSAATVVIHDAAGKALAAGLPVLHVESGARTLLGYDGIAFVDDLRAENRLLVGEGESACEVRFRYRRGEGGALPVLGPLRCAAPEPGR